MLTQKQVKELFYYDSLTGIFTWKDSVNKRNQHIGKAAGCIHGGYIRIKVNGERYFAHT